MWKPLVNTNMDIDTVDMDILSMKTQSHCSVSLGHIKGKGLARMGGSKKWRGKKALLNFLRLWLKQVVTSG